MAAVIIWLVVVLRLRCRGRSASYCGERFEDELTKGPPNASNPIIITPGEQNYCVRQLLSSVADLCMPLFELLYIT